MEIIINDVNILTLDVPFVNNFFRAVAGWAVAGWLAGLWLAGWAVAGWAVAGF